MILKWSIIALTESPRRGQQNCSYTILMKLFLTRTSYTKLAVEGSRSLSLNCSPSEVFCNVEMSMLSKSQFQKEQTHHYPEVVTSSEKKEKPKKRCDVCHQMVLEGKPDINVTRVYRIQVFVLLHAFGYFTKNNGFIILLLHYF